MPICAHATFVAKEECGEHVICFAAAELDRAAMTSAGAELRRLAQANGQGRLYLDLAGIQYLTGAALGKIVALHRFVSEAGGQLTVRNVDAFPYEQFQLARLDTVLTILPK